MDNGMDGSPRILLWNYTKEEQQQIQQYVEALQAPLAVAIRKDQGYLTLRDIVHTDVQGDQEFECHERLILFYNVPSKGISFLIDRFKQRKFPPPIYAAVTEHSIDWPLNVLLEELIEEREAFKQAQQAQQEQT